MLTEVEVIALVQEVFGTPRVGLAGVGDDAAELEPRDGRVIATDAMVEGVHFRREWSAPEDIGWKLAVANIRDLDAMNAEPRAALLVLALPSDVERAWLRCFLQGMVRARDHYAPELELVGGDTTSSPGPVMASLVLVGSARGSLWSRHSLTPGCGLWLDGPVGLAACGLLALQQGCAEDPDLQAVVTAHRRPTPTPLGSPLGIVACMDLSDGLSASASAMAARSGVRIVLQEPPLPPDLAMAASRLADADARHLALHGGEDHALLAGARQCPGPGWYRVGEVVDGPAGVWLQPAGGGALRLDVQAWQHFPERPS